MDGALTFIHICVDSSQTVLEHHRSFAPFMHIHLLDQDNQYHSWTDKSEE